MTASQARVIDPILTNVARGYTNGAMVGMLLFPAVPVGARGGKIVKFGRENFRRYTTARAPGTHVATVQYGYAGESYALTDHGLAGLVPVELMEDATAVPGIDLAGGAVRMVQDVVALNLEAEQAALARNAASYAVSNKATLSGTTQWSHADSDPVKAVETAKEAVRASVGMRPNTMVIGPKVLAALKTHPVILDRIRYTGRDVPTLELLASLFGLDRVASGDAVQEDASGALVDVWGGDAVLGYTTLGTLASQGTPSYGYTYRLRNYPVVERGYYDADQRSWKYPTFDAVAPVLAGADAGFLFKDAA
ncbi:major capsid protein [Megalodesulfovibrio gigas]|nr:major capsid protein [Megalodesulfovibrio gigas]